MRFSGLATRCTETGLALPFLEGAPKVRVGVVVGVRVRVGGFRGGG
jgi:hypothetical protein